MAHRLKEEAEDWIDRMIDGYAPRAKTFKDLAVRLHKVVFKADPIT